MGDRRTVIVIIAAVLAVLAAAAGYGYLRSADQRAFKNAQLVQVFTVTQDIPKGTTGDQAISAAIKSSSIPAKFRPATALTDLNSIKGKVALTALSVNTVIVDGQFVDPRQAQVTFAQRIPAGNVAITVSVDSVRGVAGLLVPGDKVDVLVTDGDSKRLLYQNVEVIAIGTTAAPQAGDTAPAANPGSGLITFAVPAAAAQRIVYAADHGGLYLALVPPDNQPVNIPPANAGNLFNGGPTPGSG